MDAAFLEAFSKERERMAPQREAQGRVVADDLLAFGRNCEGRRRDVHSRQLETGRFVHRERFPERFAAMSRETR